MPIRGRRAGRDVAAREGRLRMARSRGAGSGIILVILGIWGAIIPFIGPLFSFAYTPDSAWEWTMGRGWLSVLPGCVAVLGGLILIGSGNRAAASLGAWLAALAGAWFVIGKVLAEPWGLGDVGTPTGDTSWMRALEELAFFSLLGVLIVFFAAVAQGRVSVRRAYPGAAGERGVRDDPARDDTARGDIARGDTARGDAAVQRDADVHGDTGVHDDTGIHDDGALRRAGSGEHTAYPADPPR